MVRNIYGVQHIYVYGDLNKFDKFEIKKRAKYMLSSFLFSTLKIWLIFLNAQTY